MASSSRSPVNASALHIFDILRLVSNSTTPLGVSEISRLLELPMSTVHRALATLEQSQYLARLESLPRYKLGPMPQFLTRAIFQRFAIRSASIPFLKRIASETGETASLSVRIGFHVVRIAIAYGRNDLYSPGRLGEARLLHQSLSGRAILADFSKADLSAYASFVQKHYPELLSEKVEHPGEARKQFLSETSEEQGDRVAIAFPVRNIEGDAIASILVADAPNDKAQELVISKCRSEVESLEMLVREDPSKYRSPYAHLDPQKIALK